MSRINKLLTRIARRKGERELERISRLPRREAGVTEHVQIENQKIRFTDGASFEEQYRQIFQRGIYDFDADVDDPLMIDAGANIGMGSLRFLQRFPRGRLIAFEPDPRIFSILETNLREFDAGNVTLNNAALWTDSDGVWFRGDEADAGRIGGDRHEETVFVRTEKLSTYLHQPVDFLKLDVEGAELPILLESKGFLSSVRNLFVEYHSFIDQRQALDNVLSLLTEAGFRYNVESALRKQPHIYNPKIYDSMDGFVHIYAYRSTT